MRQPTSPLLMGRRLVPTTILSPPPEPPGRSSASAAAPRVLPPGALSAISSASARLFVLPSQWVLPLLPYLLCTWWLLWDCCTQQDICSTNPFGHSHIITTFFPSLLAISMPVASHALYQLRALSAALGHIHHARFGCEAYRIDLPTEACDTLSSPFGFSCIQFFSRPLAFRFSSLSLYSWRAPKTVLLEARRAVTPFARGAADTKKNVNCKFTRTRPPRFAHEAAGGHGRNDDFNWFVYSCATPSPPSRIVSLVML